MEARDGLVAGNLVGAVLADARKLETMLNGLKLWFGQKGPTQNTSMRLPFPLNGRKRDTLREAQVYRHRAINYCSRKTVISLDSILG